MSQDKTQGMEADLKTIRECILVHEWGYEDALAALDRIEAVLPCPNSKGEEGTGKPGPSALEEAARRAVDAWEPLRKNSAIGDRIYFAMQDLKYALLAEAPSGEASDPSNPIPSTSEIPNTSGKGREWWLGFRGKAGEPFSSSEVPMLPQFKGEYWVHVREVLPGSEVERCLIESNEKLIQTQRKAISHLEARVRDLEGEIEVRKSANLKLLEQLGRPQPSPAPSDALREGDK